MYTRAGRKMTRYTGKMLSTEKARDRTKKANKCKKERDRDRDKT